MRRCCFCIPMLPGATALGFIGIVMCLLELVPLVTYLIDFKDFNPIGDNLNQIHYILEDMLRDQNMTTDEIAAIREMINSNLWTALLVESVLSGVYALLCLLLVIGILGDMRGLMIPYLGVQMILIVVSILAGIGITIFLFFFNVIIGVVAAVVLLNLSFLFVYFWVAVQKAYVELGHRDYKGYSPAPTSRHYDNTYPSAPQHFQMQESSRLA